MSGSRKRSETLFMDKHFINTASKTEEAELKFTHSKHFINTASKTEAAELKLKEGNLLLLTHSKHFIYGYMNLT